MAQPGCVKAVLQSLSLTISGKAGWSWGCVSAVDPRGEQSGLRTHRNDNQRLVVHADEKLTAFLELERVVCIHLLSEQC